MTNPVVPVDSADSLLSAAAGVLAIEDVIQPRPPQRGVRVRGRLLMPSQQAYGLLAERLRPEGLTPVLRRDGGDALDPNRAVLMAVPGTWAQAPQRVRLALLLFGLTVLSCLYVGAQMPEEVMRRGVENWNLLDGLPFAAGLLGILAAHELGHYLMGRRLGAPVSLPYFIPMPFGPFGTLGAVISMVAPPRDRRQLVAVAAAGPLAGLLVAIPVLLLGLSMSHVQPVPPTGYMMEGNSFLYAGLKFLMFGQWLPSNGMDVFIHPVAFAGWAGLLVTGLNLIPAGQLDGGHLAFALLGERTSRVFCSTS